MNYELLESYVGIVDKIYLPYCDQDARLKKSAKAFTTVHLRVNLTVSVSLAHALVISKLLSQKKCNDTLKVTLSAHFVICFVTVWDFWDFSTVVITSSIYLQTPV